MTCDLFYVKAIFEMIWKGLRGASLFHFPIFLPWDVLVLTIVDKGANLIKSNYAKPDFNNEIFLFNFPKTFPV